MPAARAARIESPPTQTAPIEMAAMPVQLPADPAGPAAARARFFNSGNAFNIKLPPVPARRFADEAARALAPDAPTGFVACDQSETLGCPFPATTPLMLARYAAIRPGERLDAGAAATGSIWYVIRGAGTATVAGEGFAWGEGDVFLLPGGPAELAAGAPGAPGASGAVLWCVSNEPQLALEGALPPPAGRALVEPVHFPADEIRRQLALLDAAVPSEGQSGLALIFSSDRLEAARNLLPTLTLSLNTLPPGEDQRAHRHNSAAVTLAVAGEACRTMVDGAPCPWAPWATLVTPPGAPHSHHNAGASRALFLIVQDGGLHYHARTMGFAFL